METAVMVKEELQEYVIDWEYWGKLFVFKQPRINSKASTHAYLASVKAWGRYCERTRITRPTSFDVSGYIGYLRENQYSDFTKSLYLGILKRLFAFLQAEKLYPDITEGVDLRTKRPPREPVRNTLTGRDVRRLRASIDTKTRQGLRDLIMTELALYNGLRTCEIARLRVGDLVDDGERVRMHLWRKGRSQPNPNDFVFLQPGLYKKLRAYIRKYRMKGHIFTDINHRHPRNEHLHPGTVSSIISSRMRAAGVKRAQVTPHSCRHWFATELLKKGVSPFNVQRAMGHSNLQSTLVYLHTKNLFDDNPAELSLAY